MIRWLTAKCISRKLSKKQSTFLVPISWGYIGVRGDIEAIVQSDR